ncbi:MAG: hypothetical protein KA797_05645 [Chitinophagales bacterium]|nr:hypothetical protein [Chitinophagales bacterium]
MELDSIITAYRESPHLVQLHESLLRDKRALLKGLVGSQDAIVASAYYKNHPCTNLYILSDKEEAAYFQNNLQNSLEKKDILFFPDSFKRLAQINEINPLHASHRTECVNRVSNSDTTGELICTYPAALFEKVVSKKSLDQFTIKIAVNEKLDLDHFTEMLVEHGFEHVDFVYEAGQFSIRGGIVDVFSYANEYPYRIELFDVEVESIRTFDPSSQLSQKKIAKISIVPNIQKQYAQEELVPFFSILPADSIIWLKDADMLIDIVEKAWEKANDILANHKETIYDGALPNINSFCSIKDILYAIEQFQIVEFGGKGFFVKE